MHYLTHSRFSSVRGPARGSHTSHKSYQWLKTDTEQHYHPTWVLRDTAVWVRHELETEDLQADAPAVRHSTPPQREAQRGHCWVWYPKRTHYPESRWEGREQSEDHIEARTQSPQTSCLDIDGFWCEHWSYKITAVTNGEIRMQALASLSNVETSLSFISHEVFCFCYKKSKSFSIRTLHSAWY